MPVGISAPYDGSHVVYGFIFYVILLYKIIEGAVIAIVGELYVGNVEWGGVEFFCLVQDLLKRNIDDLGLFVDEALNKPWAGEAVYPGTFAGDPFHMD